VTYNAPDNPPASDLTVMITATFVADRGTIPIYYERYAHTGPVLESAIVVASGGPGRPTRRTTALRLFAPTLDAHDLLLVDARSTGSSNATGCSPLQRGGTPWDVTAAGPLLQESQFGRERQTAHAGIPLDRRFRAQPPIQQTLSKS
jgi:hypothetical protein